MGHSARYTNDLEASKDYAFDRLDKLNQRYMFSRFLMKDEPIPRLNWFQELVLTLFRI